MVPRDIIPSLRGAGFFVARGEVRGARRIEMFEPVSSKMDFPAMERDILQWWDDAGIMCLLMVQQSTLIVTKRMVNLMKQQRLKV